MNAVLKQHMAFAVHETTRAPIGTYRGLHLTLEQRKDHYPEMIVSSASTHFLEFRAIAVGTLLNRIDHLIDALPFDGERARTQAETKAKQLESYAARVGLPFDQEARLDRL